MGEQPWRVHVVGALALDNLKGFQPLELRELSNQLGMNLDCGFLLVTFHPVTLEYEHTQQHVRELLAALEDCDLAVVATRANADTYGSLINAALEDYARTRSRFRLVADLGTQAYFSAMHHARAMVGNSSSGIIEAPSFGLPVVNIGTRQQGRVRAANVVDVECERHCIAEAIRKATSPTFSQQARDTTSPYGNGEAAERIVDVLTSVDLGPRLTTKRFCDVRWVE
jgi:UDP-hydrolysing UDP-N-acetyl-D-glucosamine 2-epimerase